MRAERSSQTAYLKREGSEGRRRVGEEESGGERKIECMKKCKHIYII